MTKAANIEAIETTTKISWDDWLKFLDEKGARDLPHKAIAELVYARLENSLENAGWWSQGVTVAYEQHIGRREPGQNSDGTYEVAASKTIDGTLDDAIELWTESIKGKSDFSRVKISHEPTMSKTDKWRHWRCNLADGSKLNVDSFQKSPGKAGLTVTHTKLPDRDTMEKWRAFWKEQLQALGN